MVRRRRHIDPEALPEFRILDLAQRPGAGPDGPTCGALLALAKLASPGQDQAQAHVLEIQPQSAPVAWTHLPSWARAMTREACAENHGRRVSLAGRALLAGSDPCLGWLELGKLRCSAQSAVPARRPLPVDRPDLSLASALGGVLARAHARARRHLPAQVAARLIPRSGAFVESVRTLALGCAAQAALDHAVFANQRSAA